MDWDGIGDEAVGLLREYIRIDTSNPPGNEVLGAKFLAEILEAEDIPFRFYESAPGKVSLAARLEGEGKGKPLILMNHIDVVPAEPEKWEVHPFSGELSDGFIWGRGALDMKGMAIMELMATIAAKREGLRLSRDLVFLACADEETSGEFGCGHLLENHRADFEADLVINEGGFASTSLIPGAPLFMVACAEKSALWLRLSVKGQGGHGSMPSGRGALERLVIALSRLIAIEQPVEITGPTRELFATLAGHWPLLEPFAKDGSVDTLRRLMAEYNLAAIPAFNAMIRNTISLNMLNSGVKVNVIPDAAEADLDCRLLPETDADEFTEAVRDALDDPEIDVEVVLRGIETQPSPTGGGFFEVLRKAVEDSFPGAITTPFMLPGMSDSRFFRRLGVPVYGIIPARLGFEELATIHGVNEKISVEDVKDGVRFMYALVEACAGSR